MNKLKFLILVLVTSFISFSACSDSDKDEPGLEKSNANSILEFKIKDAQVEINEDDKGDRWIYAVLPTGSNKASIKPTIKVSDNATVSPADGEEVDFTNDVIYKVTAENGNVAEYVVSVYVKRAADSQILSFEIESLGDNKVGIIDEENSTITFSVPEGTDITALVPTIKHNGVEVIPASGVKQNFTKPVEYAVRAENAERSIYRVVMKEQSPSDAEFVSFELRYIAPTPRGVLDKETNTLKVYVPAGENKKEMTPYITYKGHSISPAANAVQDFSKPVTYTITAQDGTKKTFKVEVLDYAFVPQITSINKTTFKAEEEIRLTGKFAKEGNRLFFLGLGKSPRYPEIIKDTENEIVALVPELERDDFMWGYYLLFVETPTGSVKYDTRIKFLEEK